MQVLLLDSSGEKQFVAYSEDFYEVTVSSMSQEKDGSHFMSGFVRSLGKQPSLIGVCKGPGRFSALRQGVAYGLGLSLGLGIPILGWSAVESFVPSEDGVFSVCIPVSKREAYLCVRELRGEVVESLVDPKVVPSRDIFDFCRKNGSTRIFCSNKSFFEEVPRGVTVSIEKPDFSRVLFLLRSRWERGEVEDSLELDYSGSSPF
ncbi:hypothetical protein [Chlamydiifrater phoenicopteri]|uniref:hypothetical protein n=1 Tax=Chlamydiifrater phoenicopteri TaxID=2681469 RepID=UPI001BCFEADB|nr:hypothetical protein [Chlamydiifrater phoenicopteri]